MSQSLGVNSVHVLLDTDIVQNAGINLLSLEEFPCSLKTNKSYHLEKKIIHYQFCFIYTKSLKTSKAK